METTATALLLLLEGRMTETIIGSALLRVFQNLIGFRHGLELGFAVGASPGLVRVIFHRHFAIGAFQHARVGGALDFEQFIIVDFGRHSDPRPAVPSPRLAAG